MPSKTCLILRSARRARLEGRTIFVQPFHANSFTGSQHEEPSMALQNYRGAPPQDESCFDGIEKDLILRKPRSGCLEGRTGLVQPGIQAAAIRQTC